MYYPLCPWLLQLWVLFMHTSICAVSSYLFTSIFTIFFINFVVGRIDIDGIRLIFWDLGGQQDLQSLWDKVINRLYFMLFRFF